MRVIALIGPMGCGKSTIAEAMAAKLGWQVLSIDQETAEGGGWLSLIAKVRKLEAPAIVESVLLPPHYRAALYEHDTTIVKVECGERERRRRLKKRGETMKPPIVQRTLGHMKFDSTSLTPERIDRLVEMARTPSQRMLSYGRR